MKQTEIISDRLKLRQWQESDLADFASLNADPKVMAFFPNLLTAEQSDALVERFQKQITQNYFGPWAVELIETGEFLGMTGLGIPRFEAHFTPCVEIGWRLAAKHWGNGYATEAAKAALNYGFTVALLNEIVAFTTQDHLASRKVMSRIGMIQDVEGSFVHPDDAHMEHPDKLVLYRINKDNWLKQQNP